MQRFTFIKVERKFGKPLYLKEVIKNIVLIKVFKTSVLHNKPTSNVQYEGKKSQLTI